MRSMVEGASRWDAVLSRITKEGELPYQREY